MTPQTNPETPTPATSSAAAPNPAPPSIQIRALTADDIPAAADAPTLDELFTKISAIALDLLPDNHPGIDPADLFLQITALREAEPSAA